MISSRQRLWLFLPGAVGTEHVLTSCSTPSTKHLSPVPGSSRWSRRCSRFHNYKGLPPPPGYDHTVRPHWHTAGRCAQTNSTIHYITTGVQNCRTFDGQNLQYFTLKCLMLWVDTISTVVQAICNKVEILYSYFSIYTLLRVPVWEERGKQYSLRASDFL